MRTRWLGLAGHLTAFATVMLAGAGVSIYLISLRQEADLIDRIVDARMSELVSSIEDAEGERPMARTAPPDVLLALAGPNSLALEAVPLGAGELLPERLRRLGPGRHLLASGDELERVLVKDVGSTRLIVSYGDAEHQRRLQSFARALLLVSLAGVAAAAIAARGWAYRLVAQRPSLRWRLAARSLEHEAGRSPSTDDARARLALAYSTLQHGVLASQAREREFIANVGHELRTPITMILTSCELLLDQPALGAKERDHLRRMSAAAEHMSDSVRSFMILARDGSLGHSEPVGLLACVVETLAPHRAGLAERGVLLRVNVGAEVSVAANREALFVVVNNLVKNAVKYTDQGSISIQHLGNSLYVADTGCGIPEGELPNIFLPFYRTRWAATSGREGLGLGLAIVKRICDHYGWTVDVRSTDGEGTTVSVEFTRAPSLFR